MEMGPAGGESVVALPGRSLSKSASLTRRKTVGVLMKVMLSRSDEPVSSIGAVAGRLPESGVPGSSRRESWTSNGVGAGVLMIVAS